MDEKKKVIEDVDKDRRYAIDASIVRIMKSRKVLPHQQLVLECVEQLGRMFKVVITYHKVFILFFIFYPGVYLNMRMEWHRSCEHTNLVYGVAHIDILTCWILELVLSAA